MVDCNTWYGVLGEIVRRFEKEKAILKKFDTMHHTLMYMG
jgi:hypothetical protein